MELFLNRLGRRVYFKEVGGLFSKRAGLKRYLQIRAIGSRSDGSDWIGPRSNRDRWNRIEGPWEFGRVGWRRDSPESISRARRIAGVGQSIAPRVNSTRIWVWGGLRNTRNPPRASAGLGDGRCSVHSEGGGSARRRPPACDAQAVLVPACVCKVSREHAQG